MKVLAILALVAVEGLLAFQGGSEWLQFAIVVFIAILGGVPASVVGRLFGIRNGGR